MYCPLLRTRPTCKFPILFARCTDISNPCRFQSLEFKFRISNQAHQTQKQLIFCHGFAVLRSGSEIVLYHTFFDTDYQIFFIGIVVRVISRWRRFDNVHNKGARVE